MLIDPTLAHAEEQLGNGARADIGVIVHAAANAASLLALADTVEAAFAPNDATTYRVVITRKPPMASTLGVSWSGIPTGEYLVTLLDGSGHGVSNVWGGRSLHVDYVATKWTQGHTHTAAVLAVFLGHLVTELARY